MTSFDFNWTEGQKPTGKVFARKRNLNASKPKDVKTKPDVQQQQSDLAVPSTQDRRYVRKLTVNQSEKSQMKTKNFGSKPNTNKNIDSSSNTPNIKLRGNLPLLTDRNEETFDNTSKYVKRKQKKDKLAAKALQSDGGSMPIPFNKTQNVTSSLFSVRHKDIYINTNIPGRSVVEKVFSAEKKFSDLDIHKYLVSNLTKHSFTTLTKVQEKAIPVITSGKNVLIRSQTGSGKTLAYAVPIIDALQNLQPRLQRTHGVQVIIVVPTRELAIQVHELFNKINTFQWIVVGHLCGGENRKTEKDRLRKGVHILIGTPGRLLDHILHTAAFKTTNIRCLVLDEADRLLDMGFKKDIVKIVEELDKNKGDSSYDPIAMLKGTHKKFDNEEQEEETDTVNDSLSPLKNTKSKNRQTLLLSATLTKGIAELADFTMKDHIYIDSLDEFDKINPDHMIIPNTVKQEFIMTYVKHKLFTLSAILLAKSNQKIFVFMATSQMVDYHYELFKKCLLKMPKNRGKLKSGDVVLLEGDGFDDSDDEEEIVLDTELFKLHGSMDQAARKEVFAGFRNAKKGVLLCTDVAARGIDVPEADCIIQYTGPQTDQDYLHRVGRTGRAGKCGSSIIFLTHEEQEYISCLQRRKVFLKKCNDDFLKYLCDVMEEPDQEKAATALQRRYENSTAKDKELRRLACFAYSSWSRFYNTYPGDMRTIFNFKNINLGHYVTSFGLKETPSSVAKVVRGEVGHFQPKKLNKKLATHRDDGDAKAVSTSQKRKIKSAHLTMSEYSSGLEPAKKKKKKNK